MLGWSPKLPMSGGRVSRGGGIGAAYGLGMFSGIASACCAPVLIGVTVLAGATGSFPAALTVSFAYVTGMVAPLLMMALGFDRFGKRAARAMQGRRAWLWPGGTRRVPLGGLLSGLLLVSIGALTIVLAVTGPDMPTEGWRLRFAADLQHVASSLGERLAWPPGRLLVVLLVLGAVALKVRPARRHPARSRSSDESHAAFAPATTTTQEGIDVR